MGTPEDDDDAWSSEAREALSAGKRPAIERAILEGLEPVMPPADALPALLAEVRKIDRLTHFAPALAELYDLTPAQANDLIRQIRGTEGWEAGPGPGDRLLPVHTGPKARENMAAVVYLEAGAEFPQHPHLGREQVLVLEGAYLDSSGAEYWRGDLHESTTGSAHAFRAVGGIPCICAALNAVSPEDP